MLRDVARIAFALSLTQAVFAQQASQAQPSAPGVESNDRAEQMRADLNQMESLMNNMQSEINLLRDQNLQILLTTNVRLWTILIRDLHRRLEEEQRRLPASTHAPGPTSNDP